MIGTIFATAGEPVLLQGVASDYDKAISAIEFSLDEGESWTRYDTFETCSGKSLYWSFEYMPKRIGQYKFLIRSVNELGHASPEPSCVTVLVQ